VDGAARSCIKNDAGAFANTKAGLFGRETVTAGRQAGENIKTGVLRSHRDLLAGLIVRRRHGAIGNGSAGGICHDSRNRADRRLSHHRRIAKRRQRQNPISHLTSRLRSPHQKRSRALNCATRAPRVLVNRPNVGLFSEVERPVKLVWLKKLKESALSWNLRRSVIATFLPSEKS